MTIELPVEYRDRPAGSVSKLNTVSDGMGVILTIVRILRHYRPLLFFSSLSLIFCVAGLMAGLPVVEEYIRDQFITRVPLAVLAAALETIAFLLLAVGIILDSLSHHESYRSELNYLKEHHRGRQE